MKDSHDIGSADSHLISDYLSNFIDNNKNIVRIKCKVKNAPLDFKDWSDRIRFDEYLKLEDGKGIKCDATIYCTGPKPSNNFTINAKTNPEYIEVSRHMKCTQFGNGSVYAIGDCCQIKNNPLIPKMGS